MEIKNIKTYADLQTALHNKKVSGYIWMVSHKIPCIYDKAPIKFENLKHKTPIFNKIQEAYLFVDEYSIHVKNIDGKELIFIHKEDDFNNNDFKKLEDKDILKFPSHINGVDYIYFKQVYKLTSSISGKDFKTYQPIVRLFKGFSNQKNN